MNPLVSVIVPTRNSAGTLQACLDSVRQQTYNHIELIVVDNFSTDQTLAFASRYTPHIFQQGPERSAQRNFGVRQATGEYVLIIDSDMKLEQSVVGACVDTVQRRLDCKAVIIPEESFGDGFWAQCKQLERSFYHGVDWIEAARFFETTLYRRLGGYNEAMVSGEDWELSSRASQLTTVCRIEPSIHHNEGRLRLGTTLKKKLYYADQFTKYTAAARETQSTHGSQPVGIVLRRFGLFLSRPGKLFRRPHVGLGMLFMKVCEFGFGAAGYIFAKFVRGNNERA
jgi:glycosyltransferase involved in cell wall biosynthesis